MRLTVRIALLAGLALLIALLAREGTAILTPIEQAGWVLLWLVPLHALPLLLDTRGWQALIPERVPATRLFWIATVREAVNRLLPVANIGGELIGIRLLAAGGVEGVAAAASVTAEVVLTLFSQYLFVLIGVTCLLSLTSTVRSAADVLIGLAASLPLIVLFAALLHSGAVFERMEKVAVKMLGEQMLWFFNGKWSALDGALRALLSDWKRWPRTILWQLAGMLSGTLETWLALRWLGHPVSAAAAVVLESLMQAARTFIFIVPAGIGIQEATLVGVGRLIGVDTDLALALSLTKRMREILFSAPALLSWYWTEGKRELHQIRSSTRL